MPKGRVPRLRLLSELDSCLDACDYSEIAKPHFLKDTMTERVSPQEPCSIRMDSGKAAQLSVFLIKLTTRSTPSKNKVFVYNRFLYILTPSWLKRN